MVSIRQDCIEDEDEDVILQVIYSYIFYTVIKNKNLTKIINLFYFHQQGSELHVVLTEMGLKDFECAPVERTEFSDPESLHYNQRTKVIYCDICIIIIKVIL